MLWRVVSFAGLIVMVGIAYAMSTRRDAVRWKTVLVGVGLQLVFGFFILGTPVGQPFFNYIGKGINGIINCTTEGSRFVFGFLGDGEHPFTKQNNLFVLAFQVFPIIIFVSSLSAVLYHFGVLQVIVRGMAYVMKRFMGTSGAESLSVAANVFVGMVEAPLVIRPYVEKMTRSELFCLMTAGMATIAGNMLVFYAFVLGGFLENAAGHLLAASVMSAPAAIAIAKLMIPETEESLTSGTVKIEMERESVNAIDAASRGAVQGLQVAINVAAMLIAFIAFVHLINIVLNLFPGDLSLQKILGWVCAPFALVMGVPTEDALKVGFLLGEKVIVNECVAYLEMQSALQAQPGWISPRSVKIATYALCGFANFGSLGIMIAGVGSIAPSRRKDLARLGLKAIIAGSLAAFMTACVAGIMI